jgi:hypothetical protein
MRLLRPVYVKTGNAFMAIGFEDFLANNIK